jgi:hypothetical protein
MLVTATASGAQSSYSPSLLKPINRIQTEREREGERERERERDRDRDRDTETETERQNERERGRRERERERERESALHRQQCQRMIPPCQPVDCCCVIYAGCRPGWGSYIQLTPGTLNPSTLPTQPPACPPFKGFYYPQSKTASKSLGLPYKGYCYPTPHPDYSKCQCQKCPAGYTSAGGAIEQCSCVLAAAVRACAGLPNATVPNAQPWPESCADAASGQRCRPGCQAGYS